MLRDGTISFTAQPSQCRSCPRKRVHTLSLFAKPSEPHPEEHCGWPLADRNASRRMAADTIGPAPGVPPSFETAAHDRVRPPQDEGLSMSVAKTVHALARSRCTASGTLSRRNPLRVQRGGVLDRLDDVHIAGATADVSAQCFADVRIGMMPVAPQQPGRLHDEARRAIAALRAELLVEAALHRGKTAVAGERFDGVDAAALDGRREREAGEPRLV